MDDYKRQLYMEAQRMIRDNESEYVCQALGYALENEGFLSVGLAYTDIFLFPEFQNLYDGKLHFKDGKIGGSSRYGGWWEIGWKEPRIRALDCILNSGV